MHISFKRSRNRSSRTALYVIDIITDRRFYITVNRIMQNRFECILYPFVYFIGIRKRVSDFGFKKNSRSYKRANEIRKILYQDSVVCREHVFYELQLPVSFRHRRISLGKISIKRSNPNVMRIQSSFQNFKSAEVFKNITESNLLYSLNKSRSKLLNLSFICSEKRCLIGIDNHGYFIRVIIPAYVAPAGNDLVGRLIVLRRRITVFLLRRSCALR